MGEGPISGDMSNKSALGKQKQIIYRAVPANSFVSGGYKKGAAAKYKMKEVPRYENDKKLRAGKSSLERNCAGCTCGREGIRAPEDALKVHTDSEGTQAFLNARENGCCKRCANKNAVSIGNCRSSVNILLPDPGMESPSTCKENALFNKIYAQHINRDYTNVMNQIQERSISRASAVSEAEIAEIVAASRQPEEHAHVVHDGHSNYFARRGTRIAEELRPEYVPLDQPSCTCESSSYEYEGYYTDLGHASEYESVEEMFRSSYSSDETPDPKIWYNRQISSKQKLKIDKLNVLSTKKDEEKVILECEDSSEDERGLEYERAATKDAGTGMQHTASKEINTAGDKESYRYLDRMGIKKEETVPVGCFLGNGNRGDDERRSNKTDEAAMLSREEMEAQKEQLKRAYQREDQNYDKDESQVKRAYQREENQNYDKDENGRVIQDKEIREASSKENDRPVEKELMEQKESTRADRQRDDHLDGRQQEYSFMLADDVVQNKNMLLERIKKKFSSKLSGPDRMNNKSFIIRRETAVPAENEENQGLSKFIDEHPPGENVKMRGMNRNNNFIRRYDVSDQNFVIDDTAKNTKELEKKFVKCMKEHLKLNEGVLSAGVIGDQRGSNCLKNTFVQLLNTYTAASINQTISEEMRSRAKCRERIARMGENSEEMDEKVYAAEKNLLLHNDSFYVTALENNALENKKMQINVKTHNFKIVIKKERLHVDEQVEVSRGDSSKMLANAHDEKTIYLNNFSQNDISGGIKEVETKIFNLDEQIRREYTHNKFEVPRTDVKREDSVVEVCCMADDQVAQESNRELNTSITEYRANTIGVDAFNKEEVKTHEPKVIEEEAVVVANEKGLADVVIAENAENIQTVDATNRRNAGESTEGVFFRNVIGVQIVENPERELEKELRQRCRTQYVEGSEIKSIEVPVTEKKVFSLYEPYHDYNFERLFYQFHIEECESLKEFGHANIIGKMHYRSETNFFNFNWAKLSERKLFCYKPEFSYIRREESDLLSPSLNEKFHALDFAVELEGAKLFLYSAPTFTLQNAIKLIKCKNISEFMDITNFHVVNVTPKGSKYLVDISNDQIRKQFMIKDLSFIVESSGVKYFFRVETLKAFINWLACLYMRIHNLKGYV
ncbi:hypothetical protein THOM_0171 [Trachipleistophora hominis]|uniref:PH domain-containing protein n=1 Tax=Trachipleistophora hominis TaxID=72359 RepID=L7K0J6_TRAHO|nr:hypothetical protein THOM_0171 [Trachipleistophora hominis]